MGMKMREMKFSIISIAIFGLFCATVNGAPYEKNVNADNEVYQIGVGIADATGPAAQVNMMGYSIITQTVSGIHLRQFSRAFIFGDDNARVVFVSIDAQGIDTAITTSVISKLQEKYGDLYTADNVCISGTHTHSGPAGFFQYLLYDITSLGFINSTFDALVNGIVQSISNAHDSLQPGYILYDQGDLTDASINRSPTSYQNNPEDEKAKYEYDTDKNMFLLKLVDLDGNDIGMVKLVPFLKSQGSTHAIKVLICKM